MINFKQVLTDLDGNALKEPDGSGPDGKVKIVPVTLSRVAVFALLTSLPDDQKLDGVAKARLFMLAQSIKDAAVELPAEDVALIKDRIAKTQGALVVGRCFEMLDPASLPRDGKPVKNRKARAA